MIKVLLFVWYPIQIMIDVTHWYHYLLMYMYVRQAYFTKKLMLMSRMIDDNLASLSKIVVCSLTRKIPSVDYT